MYRQQVLARHTGTSGMEFQLADGNPGAIGPKVTQTKDAAAVSDADEPDVFLRPVFQNIPDPAPPRDREIHATRLPVDVAELEARLADGRVVDNREKPRRVRHDGSIEKRFVVVEQLHEVGVAIEVRVLVAELRHDAGKLQVLRLCNVGHEAKQAEGLFLRLGERSRFVE
jgi:hypothetical protein